MVLHPPLPGHRAHGAPRRASGQTVVDFKSGKADGHVFVFELPSGKAIGGYPFKAESSAKVKSNELDSDFRANLSKALATGLGKADPGATLGFQINPSRK